MKAAEFISTLKTRGIDLWQEGSALRYRAPAGVLTDHEKATLRAHKSAILRVLGRTPTSTSGQPVPAPVRASTVTAGPLPNRTKPPEPAVRECRNCARFEAYHYEPLGSCHALQRMQNASSKPARFGCSHFEPKEEQS